MPAPAVDLAGDHRVFALDLQLAGVGRLGPAKKRGQHLAGGIDVVVDRLFAADRDKDDCLGKARFLQADLRWPHQHRCHPP